MFFKGKDDEIGNTVINIPCTCGTHSINFSYFDDDCNECYVSFFVDSFYMQDGIFRTIAKRLKRAFLILCGKSYQFEEMCLNKTDLEKLEKEIHTILENKKEDNNE